MVGFDGAARFVGPDVLLVAIVAGFEVGSRSGHRGGMSHWDLFQSSAATVGRCRCYAPSVLSFFLRWTRGSHHSVAVLTPVGIGAGRLW